MPREATVAEQVRPIAERVAASRGLDVFDVQFRREAAGMVLRVLLDRAGPAATAEESVSIEDCAHVSRDLSAALDVEDVIPSAYTLEVSSPGLDRPLRHASDYRRFAGRRAKIVMRQPVDGQGYFKGRLAGLEDIGTAAPGDARSTASPGTAVLIDDDEGRRHRVPVDLITRANLEVEF